MNTDPKNGHENRRLTDVWDGTTRILYRPRLISSKFQYQVSGIVWYY